MNICVMISKIVLQKVNSFFSSIFSLDLQCGVDELCLLSSADMPLKVFSRAEVIG